MSDDDLKLARYAQKGDLDAFNRLVLKYQDMAFNVAYRILSDPAAAEDATQDAFLAAYTKIKTFRGGSFRSWMMRIVTNTCYDELRRQKRRPTTPLEPINPVNGEEIDSPAWLIDTANSPEEEAELSELDRAVQHCLDGLHENFRVVVILVDIQGFDYQETAEAVKTPLGTIKSRLARGRSQMQECLQQFWELLPSKFRLNNEELA
jgi:RNA polymerase sigma-70 factor (ECF subfamily)